MRDALGAIVGLLVNVAVDIVCLRCTHHAVVLYEAILSCVASGPQMMRG